MATERPMQKKLQFKVPAALAERLEQYFVEETTRQGRVVKPNDVLRGILEQYLDQQSTGRNKKEDDK